MGLSKSRSITARIASEHWETLMIIGEGNLSKGIRGVCEYLNALNIKQKVKKQVKQKNMGKL